MSGLQPGPNHGYLAVTSPSQFTPSQLKGLSEVTTKIEVAQVGGKFIAVVGLNLTREGYRALRVLCESEGLTLVTPPATAPGVTFFPFR